MKNIIFLFSLIVCFISCDDIIEVLDISDETVTVLAPTSNSVINTTSLTFTWEGIEAAEQYHLQVAVPTFENAIQISVDTLIAKTSYTKTLEAGNYEWRVRAENSDYQTSYTMNSFTIEE